MYPKIKYKGCFPLNPIHGFYFENISTRFKKTDKIEFFEIQANENHEANNYRVSENINGLHGCNYVWGFKRNARLRKEFFKHSNICNTLEEKIQNSNSNYIVTSHVGTEGNCLLPSKTFSEGFLGKEFYNYFVQTSKVLIPVDKYEQIYFIRRQLERESKIIACLRHKYILSLCGAGIVQKYFLCRSAENKSNVKERHCKSNENSERRSTKRYSRVIFPNYPFDNPDFEASFEDDNWGIGEPKVANLFEHTSREKYISKGEQEKEKPITGNINKSIICDENLQSNSTTLFFEVNLRFRSQHESMNTLKGWLRTLCFRPVSSCDDGLHSHIELHQRNTDKLLRIVSNVSTALDFLHCEGLIHMNMNLDSIYVSDTDEGYLGGFSRACQPGSWISREFEIVYDNYFTRGSGNISNYNNRSAPMRHLFSSPESLLKEPCDCHADVYSLGIIILYAYFVLNASLINDNEEGSNFLENLIHKGVLQPEERAGNADLDSIFEKAETFVVQAKLDKNLVMKFLHLDNNKHPDKKNIYELILKMTSENSYDRPDAFEITDMVNAMSQKG